MNTCCSNTDQHIAYIFVLFSIVLYMIDTLQALVMFKLSLDCINTPVTLTSVLERLPFFSIAGSRCDVEIITDYPN